MISVPHFDRVHVDLVHEVRQRLRMLRPQQGAVANACDEVQANHRAASQRRDAALLQARALGPQMWTPLDQPATRAGQRHAHAVHFYASDAALLARLTSFVGGGLADGEACLVIADGPQLAGLRQSLSLSGLGRERDRGRLLTLDADRLLDRFLRDGWPDPELFDLSVGATVRQCVVAGVPVRAFGQMVGILHRRGELAAALQVEKLWDALHLTVDFPLLCAYPVLDAQDDDEVRARVHARHTHLAAAAGM